MADARLRRLERDARAGDPTAGQRAARERERIHPAPLFVPLAPIAPNRPGSLRALAHRAVLDEMRRRAGPFQDPDRLDARRDARIHGVEIRALWMAGGARMGRSLVLLDDELREEWARPFRAWLRLAFPGECWADLPNP